MKPAVAAGRNRENDADVERTEARLLEANARCIVVVVRTVPEDRTVVAVLIPEVKSNKYLEQLMRAT